MSLGGRKGRREGEKRLDRVKNSEPKSAVELWQTRTTNTNLNLEGIDLHKEELATSDASVTGSREFAEVLSYRGNSP